MLTAPYDHPLNLTTQAVLTYGSWALTAVLFAIAVKKDVRYRRPFFSFLILAGMVGALAEPLYDVGFMLLFYVPGIWSTFSAFGIPQPVWAYSGYVVLYTGTAMFICEQIQKGLTPKGLYGWAGLALLMSVAFEIIGIQGDAYAYWGPHAFRIFDYPLAVGVLESAQVICFSLAASELRRRTSGTVPLLGLFVIFPCTFYLVNFGAGAPLIISLHLDKPSPTLVTLCSAISIFFALLLIWSAAKLLPKN
ncbi:hypothetical protein [Rhodoferax ferrireducens]|uniref:hypothetical protein n=1 Tax=Rhodoferax ferrireducens TaxID=192843 RepID=UPI000E0DA3D1|nr:hypothetical protein [Rhodoferax ferrireducens]